jgi:GNAT superfamily N-acetyltransferase
MSVPFEVEAHRADAHNPVVLTYLNDVLLPGIAHPTDHSGLFATDVDRLVAAEATVITGRVGDKCIVGLYLTVDQDGFVWVRGVRVLEPFRGLGYGSRIVREACKVARRERGINKAALAVRCDDGGHPRGEVFRTYLRCGFHFVRVFAVRIVGSPYDRHLGPAGSSFLTARMEATL